MTTSTQKLDAAVLAILREYDGKLEVSMNGTSNFQVTITDEGQQYWDVPHGVIGFQMPA